MLIIATILKPVCLLYCLLSTTVCTVINNIKPTEPTSLAEIGETPRVIRICTAAGSAKGLELMSIKEMFENRLQGRTSLILFNMHLLKIDFIMKNLKTDHSVWLIVKEKTEPLTSTELTTACID